MVNPLTSLRKEVETGFSRYQGTEKGSVFRLTPTGAAGSFVVILALLALLLVPPAVQQRADRLRLELDRTAIPAAAFVSELRYLLALQVAELRAFLIDGDPVHLSSYEVLRAREEELHRELERHADPLGGAVVSSIAELRTLSDEWHQNIDVGVIRATGPGGSPPAVLEEALFLRSIEASAEADSVLGAVTEERYARIAQVEGSARAVNVGLLVIALGGALAVARLDRRIRGLAEESERRRREVEQAMSERTRAMESRADLIRGFTHDVKNPLGIADGYAELLLLGLRGDLTDEQRETVTRIRNSIGGAIEIINELLDLSRLEGGGLQLNRTEVDVLRIADELLHGHAEAAAAAGIELTLVTEASASGSTRAFTDPDRIRQILGNLISNAIKYTPAPGRILVSIGDGTTEAAPRPGSWIAVRVSDTGSGIPLEEQDRIFDEFHRVPGSAGRGHGLGLAISRRVARLLGGDVTVRSVLGQGSTFTLWLPIRHES